MQKAWVFKSVSDNDRALQTVESYDDNLELYYNYDSLVANHRQVSVGDYVVLINKRIILGYSTIQSISMATGEKTVSKCPECGSSTIDRRKTMTPIYRCNKGHEFSHPIKTSVEVKKYRAIFGSTFQNIDKEHVALSQLRPYYSSGYNQNLSIQALDPTAMRIFVSPEAPQTNIILNKRKSLRTDDFTLLAKYFPNTLDEREISLRAITLRRGQQSFRDRLRGYYGDICLVTGCSVHEILEAAHINPFRGAKDDHTSNGLLLRADVHTLFDLDLIGIDSSLRIHVHEKVFPHYSEYHHQMLKCGPMNSPSPASILARWEKYRLNQ